MGRPARFIGLFLALLMGTVAASHSSAQSAPYPPSSVISGVTWDFTSHIQLAPGSDLWPMTWAADGTVSTSWGDGGGFGGTNDNGRVSLGFASIAGAPPAVAPVNIWGGFDALHSATFGGKVSGMLSVGGTLYGLSNTQNAAIPDIALLWSSDNGASWQEAWAMPARPFAPSTFLNFGRDYAGARDGYVYVYGGSWLSASPIVLARVPQGQIRTRTAYEYMSGLDANGAPQWSSDVTQAEPVFDDPGSSEFNGATHFSVVYDAAIGRYLATVSHEGIGQLGIFDAPEPWGPWTTVAYYSDWGSFGAGEALIYAIPTPWMSTDGLRFWCAFSSTGSLDSFNLIAGRLTLRAATDLTAPAPPSNLLVSPP